VDLLFLPKSCLSMSFKVILQRNAKKGNKDPFKFRSIWSNHWVDVSVTQIYRPLLVLSEKCVSCGWSELPNEGTIVAPNSPSSNSSCQYHRTYDQIQLTYLFIQPPVAGFHYRVDTFLSIVAFLCLSIQHTFPEHRLLHEELNLFNTIAVKETSVIIVAKVLSISKASVTNCVAFPRVDGHRVGHLVQPFE